MKEYYFHLRSTRNYRIDHCDFQRDYLAEDFEAAIKLAKEVSFNFSDPTVYVFSIKEKETGEWSNNGIGLKE